MHQIYLKVCFTVYILQKYLTFSRYIFELNNRSRTVLSEVKTNRCKITISPPSTPCISSLTLYGPDFSWEFMVL